MSKRKFYYLVFIHENYLQLFKDADKNTWYWADHYGKLRFNGNTNYGWKNMKDAVRYMDKLCLSRGIKKPDRVPVLTEYGD